jgi:FkbM family methyltransferase
LKKFFPETIVLTAPGWGKIPLRTNGYDYGLLAQIFIRQDYRLECTGVQRILDLGANIGMATIYLHRLFPQAEIACVEPSPDNIPLLKRAVSLNGIRGRIFEAAVGAEPGEIHLHVSDLPDCTSAYPVEGVSRTVAVLQISVPEIMDRMGWDNIDLVKIDIEGSEKDVLGRNNCWLRGVRIITGESHVNTGYPYAQLQADLQPFGFVFKTLIPETTEYGASFQASR